MSRRGEFLRAYSMRAVPRSYLAECVKQLEGKTEEAKEWLAERFTREIEERFPLKRQTEGEAR